MTNKRFIVDDAGTLIDMQTRDTYDYVSEVCELLNTMHEINLQLNSEIRILRYKRSKEWYMIL